MTTFARARLLSLAAMLAACSSTVAVEAEAAAVPARSPGPARLERDLVDALAADDAEIRREALAAMEWLGTSDHVAAVARCLHAEAPEERAAALRTLGAIADNDADAQRAVTAHLVLGLRDGAHICKVAALRAFSSPAAADWTEVEALLASNDWELRLEAMSALLRRDRSVHPADLAAALREFLGTAFERRVARALTRLSDPAQRSLLASLAEGQDARTRHLAAEAAARLDAIAAGAPDPRPASQRAREAYEAENRAAEQRLAALPWREIAPEQLIAAVRSAPLVLFAEMHWDDGPLRAAQQRVLAAMAEDRPGDLVVGFEPSVESAQRGVLDRAATLGVATRSLEADWRVLLEAERSAERDDQAAAAINACLRERPDRRMLVLRGESHCLPGGYLCRQLDVPPVIVLCVRYPPLRSLGDDPRVVDRTFRIGDDGRLFFWGVMDVLQPELMRRLVPQR